MQELQQLLDSGKVDSVPIVLEFNHNYPGMAELIQRRVEVIQAFPAGTDGYCYVVGRVTPSRSDLAQSRTKKILTADSAD